MGRHFSKPVCTARLRYGSETVFLVWLGTPCGRFCDSEYCPATVPRSLRRRSEHWLGFRGLHSCGLCSGGNPRRRESRDSGKNVGPKEDSAQRCRIDAETNVKPVSDNTGITKPPAKASRLNKEHSFSTIPRERCSPNRSLAARRPALAPRSQTTG